MCMLVFVCTCPCVYVRVCMYVCPRVELKGPFNQKCMHVSVIFMYYYVTFSVLLCGVAVWCIMYFWVITIICLFYFGNMFYCTDYDFVFTNNE